MRRALWFMASLSACRFGFSDRDGGARGDDGGPPDELGLSLDATILPDGVTVSQTACGSTVLMQDGFDALPAGPTFTTYTSSSLTLQEMNSRFEIVFAASVGNGKYTGYQGAAVFPTEGLCGSVRIAATPASNGMAYFKLTSGTQQIEFTMFQGMLSMRTHLGGAVATVQSIAFDPIAHAHLRLRQQGGMTYWDVSPDGVTYNALVSTVFVTDPMLYFELGAGSFGSSTNAGMAAFDDALLLGP